MYTSMYHTIKILTIIIQQILKTSNDQFYILGTGAMVDKKIM